MSSIKLESNASGTGIFTIASPNSNTNRTLSIPDATTTIVGTDATQTLTNKTIQGGAITSGTSVTASSTSVDFTGIPSWVKRITVMFNGVSTSGTSQPMFQLGDAGGIETTGYTTFVSSVTTVINSAAAYTNGWQIFSANATRIIQGNIVFALIDSATNTWSGSGIFANETPAVIWTVGTKALSATLDRVRITTANGTDTFDAGTINILYEG